MNYKNKGFTIIELIVTIAILAVAGSFMMSSYMNVMEKKRLDSDEFLLDQIEYAAKQMITNDELMDEVIMIDPSSKSEDGRYIVENEETGAMATKEFTIPLDKTDKNKIVLKIDELNNGNGLMPELLKNSLIAEVGPKVELKSMKMRELKNLKLEITIYCDRQNNQQNWKVLTNNVDANMHCEFEE